MGRAKRIATATPAGPELVATDVAGIRLELARARQLARAWAATVAETRRPDLAALFARHALSAYGAVAAPQARLSEPFANPFGYLDATPDALAATMGEQAAKLPQVEALHYLTSLYAALLPEELRGALGAFYTPPALAARLLDQAEEAGLDWTTARVLDPATGGGAFLVHAADRMRRALGNCEPRLTLAHIRNRLHGLELDPHAAGLAQMALEIVLADLTAAADAPAPTMLCVCDTLEMPPAATFDLVVGNPPYGRVTLTEPQRHRFVRSLYGHANLYGVFTDIALRWTKPGGLIAYLTPTSFLAGQYYSALRGLLAKEAPPASIDFVHARRGVFEDVLQETLLAVYRKGQAPGRAQIHYLNVTSELSATVTRNGTVGLPTPPTAPWLAPRDPQHAGLIANVETMPDRLSTWGYSVSTGPLVWNRHKRQMRERAAGAGVHPIVWAEAVLPSGRFVYRAEKRNHAPFFKLERGDAWLLVEEPCVLVQRTTSKEQARRLIAAEMPSGFVQKHGGVVVENHLNMILAASPKAPAAVVAALLNSDVLDQVFRCMSGSVAVSAFELEALPLPPVESLDKLAGLVSRGAAHGDIEAECRRLYGVAA
jgi:adenine-specific DNA-methyltransferase